MDIFSPNRHDVGVDSNGVSYFGGEFRIDRICKMGPKKFKNWLGAIGFAGLSYGSELVKCAFVGAAVGMVGSLLGVGAVANVGGVTGSGISISRAGMILAEPGVTSVLSNIGTSFGIGVGWTGAGIALGSRAIFGGESAARTYALDEYDDNGNPFSVLDSAAKGALPEYELASRLGEQGLSGLKWSDALIGLYFLNLKVDPRGTYRDPKGTLRNSRNNPTGQRPGSIAKDSQSAKSGGTGKAYEDSDLHIHKMQLMKRRQIMLIKEQVMCKIQ